MPKATTILIGVNYSPPLNTSSSHHRLGLAERGRAVLDVSAPACCLDISRPNEIEAVGRCGVCRGVRRTRAHESAAHAIQYLSILAPVLTRVPTLPARATTRTSVSCAQFYMPEIG